MSTVVPLLAVTTHITGIDWLVIALYFCILGGVAWWVIRNEQGHRRRLLPGRPQPRLVGHRRVDLRLEHRLRAHRRPGRDRARPTAWRWRITSCTPGACWCWPGCSCRSTCARMVFTMPEFLERRFSSSRATCSRSSRSSPSSSPRSPWASSPAAWCSARCCRSCSSTSAAIDIDSFWIGSVLVIVLTGLYTALGGMRAVAYNDAVQVVVLIVGSALLTFYGLNKLGGWGELRAHLRLGHVQPLEAADPARRRGHLGAGDREERRRPAHHAGLVLQQLFSLARACSSAPRSSASGTGAPTSTSCSAPSALPTRPSPAAAASSPPS